MTDLEKIRAIALDDGDGGDPPVDAGGAPPQLSGNATATTYVVQGVLLGLADDLSATQAADVRNSLLFAQLAANATASRTADAQSWYETYQQTLATVGWSTASYSYNRHDIARTVDWAKATLELFPSQSPRAEAREAISAADTLSSKAPARTVWSQAVTGENGVDFSVAAASIDANGPKLCQTFISPGLHFEQTGFLDWKSDYSYYAGVRQSVLNEEVYAAVRSMIEQRLGDRIARYIIPVT